MKNVALILLYDNNKNFLLQHRTDDAPTHPGYYGAFGGKIEDGETPEEAAIRECFEELEYRLKNPKLVLSTVKDCKYGKRNVYVYIEKYNPDKQLVLHEGQGMKWVTEKEINSLKLADYLIDIIKDMYNKI